MARQPPRPPNGVQFSHRLLKTSVKNPYETFTAPQFDNWVDDLTSTIRNALSGKARGKARDPREGAGLDGLRRLFAQPGDSVEQEESFAADESYDKSYESDQQHAPQESMDLTQDGDAQQHEEIDFFSDNEDEVSYGQDAAADEYYGRESPVAADDDDQQETLDFDAIYANGASHSETRASPTWSIEAEGNTTLQRDDDEYEEDYVEGEEYNEGEEYAEDEYYDDEDQEAYAYYQGTQPTAPAVREVLEIDDDGDEEEEEAPLPSVHTARLASAVTEQEEEVDELDDEDKENAIPARSPSIARSTAYAYSPSYTRRTPLSSVRGGDAPSPRPASQQATPSPSPAQRSSQPEVFTISDDEDEVQPTPTPAPPHPMVVPVAQEGISLAPTDQAVGEFDLDSLQQLPTPVIPSMSEDPGMDLFSLTDLQTRAAGPSVADYLAAGSTESQAAFDADVASYLETATPLDMSLVDVDPALLAAELAAFDAGIDAALQAAIVQGPPVQLSDIEKVATSDVASAIATAAEPAVTDTEDGPLEGNGQQAEIARDKSVGVSEVKEDAEAKMVTAESALKEKDAQTTTPPASPSPSRLHIPMTPSRERGEPLFMSPGELPVVPGEIMSDEPEKMSHPPTPHLHAPSPPALGAGHDLPHFLDRGDIEKDAPREATGSPKSAGDEEVEKVHPEDAEEKVQDAEEKLQGTEETLQEAGPEEEAKYETGVDEVVAHEMSVEEKKAFMQRDGVDPFSLMGDDSIVAPGAVETPDDDEAGEVDQLEDDEEDANGALAPPAEGEAMVTDDKVLPHNGDIDADASGESDGGHAEEAETEMAHRSTNVSTPPAVAVSPAQEPQEEHAARPESDTVDVALSIADGAGEVEPTVDNAHAEEEETITRVEAVSEPERVETRESTQPVADSIPSAMEDVLALPSPGEAPSIAATTPAADDAEPAEATSSKSRKSGRSRPLAATRSSARIARTQSSQQVSMAAPKTRTRPPNSARSEASVASASASSSVTGSALSRESTVQPTARKIKGKPKAKGKGKAKQEVEEEVDELAEEERPGAPGPTSADPVPERPPLLRTQTYRHYHGKKKASGAMPTWASLKWNSILQPALALVRMGGGAPSSATDTLPEQVAQHPSEEASVSASTPDVPAPATSNGTSEIPQADTKLEPSVEESSATDTKFVPEVVPHIADVVATSDSPSAAQANTTEPEAQPTGLHLDALPPALPPSPALPTPAVPPPPVSTPAEAPRPRGHASRPSLVIQDSFTPESGHMTRSNCRFHKISVPAAPGSGEVVQFITPACSITNLELMEAEGIIDCGVASDIDHARTVVELEVVSDEVLHVLRRLVGLELLREGEVGFVIPDGETMESLRERMPDSGNSIFHDYRKPQSQVKDAEGSSGLPHKKRKRAASTAASQASTLTELDATDEERDVADTPASRTRSRMGPVSSSSPLSPVDRRKRRRVEHEDEYKPTDADHAIEAEDDEEDYAELASKPKKRGRKSAATTRPSVAPSPADTTASTPLPAGEEGGDTGNAPGDEAAGAGPAKKKAPRRKSRKRKAGVVDPAFKPGAAQSDSESEGEEPARKTTKAKRGKKRSAAAEEGEQQEGADEAGSLRPPVSKKRKTAAAADPAGSEMQN